MSTTATGDATEAAAEKAAQRHGKQQPATVKNPATQKEKASTPDSGAEEPVSSTSEEPRDGIAENQPVTELEADNPADDPRSLAWMSAQAVSALDAVRAHQAEYARDLLARVEKPPARHTPVAGHPDEPGEAAAESQVPQPDTVATPVEVATSQPSVTDDIVSTEEPAIPAVVASGPQPAAPPPALPRRNRLALRSAVLASVLIVAGLLVYQHWPVTEDTTAPAAALDVPGGVEDTAFEAPPQPVGISAVAEAPEPARPSPDTGNAWNPTLEPAWPEPETTTVQKAPVDPQETAPQQDKAPPPGAVATTTVTPASPAPDTAGQAAVQPAAPKPAATTAPPAAPARTTRPSTPQPRYPAAGYGQYRQQPGWQQPYYRQAYPQYPSR